MKKKLRFFVAENVFCDYTCGMIAIVAYDEAHARELMAKQDIYSDYDGPIVLRELTEPECIAIHGGG